MYVHRERADIDHRRRTGVTRHIGDVSAALQPLPIRVEFFALARFSTHRRLHPCDPGQRRGRIHPSH